MKKKSAENRAEFGDLLLDHFTSDETIRNRSEMVLAVDEGLGKIMQVLDDLNILDRTFLLFTSDNGYFYGEHGLSLERRLPYEESVKTPLLIRYPPLIAENTRLKEFALSIDYAPTVLNLAGATIGSHIQGQSLIPLLEGSAQNWRNSMLIEYYSFEAPMPWLIDTDYKLLRTGRYKYIHWYKHENLNELYDLREDPFELNNLIKQENMQKTVAEMEKQLAVEVAKAFGVTNLKFPLK
jgi:N-acetylglucosamine-6-sulfatase